MATLSRNGTGYSVNDRRSYDGWGLVRAQQSGGDPTLRYCANLGHKADDESGLIYMRARYYEPSSGRFISQDLSMAGPNWFSYCDNNPVTKFDRSGDTTEEDVRSVVLGVLGNLLTGLIVKYIPQVFKIASKSLEEAEALAWRTGAELIAAGKAEIDLGAQLLRAGEASEEIAPYQIGEGAGMMLSGTARIVAGFAMQQLGYFFMLMSMG